MPRIGRLTVLSVLCALTVAALCGCNELYVATNGNDSWSGRLEEPNKDHTDGPFATLERARDAIREMDQFEGPVTVYLRKGTYYLDKPFVLSPEDSGTQKAPILYATYGGEDVTISGGKAISGFKTVEVNGHKMIAAGLPDVKDGKWSFSQLFVNNRRKSRTRLPREGYYAVADLLGVPWDVPFMQGQDKFRFNAGDMKQWKNLSDVDIVALSLWIENRMPVKSVNEADRTVELSKKSVFRLQDDHLQQGARYWVENVFEALDTPGQWYLDRPHGKLYYYPAVGEDWKRAKFVASNLEQIVRVVGDEKKNVENVQFMGLKFAHAEHRLPPDRSGASQAAVSVPAAIYFEKANNCAISECEISHIGNYAVEFGGGCHDNTVAKCRIVDLGAGGVKINQGSEKITVADNEIGDGGKIFMSAIGVWIGNSPSNKVVHNEIHDMYYTGVSLGWVWGYGESKARENLIEQNHIHHIGRGVLSDLGGIYSLGMQPGTILRNNLIHDSYSHSYGGWGIYTDEGSTDILIENNIVYNTKTGGFHQHYGKENLVRNNVFAFAKEHQLQRSREEEHNSFTFERNIVYYDEGTLLGNTWANDHFAMDYNDYWDASGRPITFAGASFEDWKKRGHDEHSLIADPKFVDAKKFNFKLKPDSPAFGLGFKQIDMSKVGPRGKPGVQ